MLLTEEEAKTKWCPQARSGEPDEGSGWNRYKDHGCCCIASECAAWRWCPDAVLELRDGQSLVVDVEDIDFLRNGVWWDGRYAKRNDGYVHRLIASHIFGEIPEEMFVDHIDGDPLNNRRGNLRVVSKAQNAANSASRGGTSSYRGVFMNKRSGKWVAQIKSGETRRCLGTFENEEEAAAAYDDAAKELHGEYARLNLTPRTNCGRRGFCGLAGKAE